MSKHNKGGLVKVQEPISGKCYFYEFIPTGRIKRLRLNNGVTKVFKSKHRRFGKKLSDKISFYQGTYPPITRWNRH